MARMFSARQIKMVTLLTMVAGLSMGNESCQKANTRVLKMDVDLGSIAAQPVVMPSGERIDFAYVTNSLFYQEVMANDHFVIANPIPTPTTTLANAASGGVQKTMAQSIASSLGFGTNGLSNDEKLIQEYGFADQLQTKAAALALKSGVNGKVIAESATADAIPVDPADLPACLYNLPQAKLAGEVVSFESSWGAGLSVGYGASGPILSGVGIGGSVKFTSARLQMGMRAVDPLNNLLIAAAKGISNQSSLNLNVNLASPALGLDFFFKTPIAKVVSGAIDKSLAAVVTSISKANSTSGSWGDAWESRVVYDPQVVNGDTQIMIRGGTRYGMVVGDQFTVTNMRYKWTGDACSSALEYKVPTTATPVANIKVIAVGDNVAVATVTQYLIEDRILPGAQVKLLQMATTP